MLPGRFHRGPGTVVSYSADLSPLQGTQMRPLYDREIREGRERRERGESAGRGRGGGNKGERRIREGEINGEQRNQ